ncbi:MAG: DUF1844 domain-containing protein [Actinomycetes bacterium]
MTGSPPTPRDASGTAAGSPAGATVSGGTVGPATGLDPQRDIAEVPAVEVISAAAVHLMSASAVKLGLAEDLPEACDLDEARKLVNALAGLVTAASEDIGHHHAAPLRDGLKSLQLAFREVSDPEDPPGQGPGERFTGPVRG